MHFTCTLPNFIGRWWEERTSQLGSAVESIAREQYRFGTQTEECHRRLLMGQVEAERRIIELEAQVAKLQDELAVQDQRIQGQRRYYEESLGKMEVSYRLLQ